MSVVTSMILTEFDSVGNRETPECIGLLNKFIDDSRGLECETFQQVDHLGGGNKCMQVGVWCGAVNYLPISLGS